MFLSIKSDLNGIEMLIIVDYTMKKAIKSDLNGIEIRIVLLLVDLYFGIKSDLNGIEMNVVKNMC